MVLGGFQGGAFEKWLRSTVLGCGEGGLGERGKQSSRLRGQEAWRPGAREMTGLSTVLPRFWGAGRGDLGGGESSLQGLEARRPGGQGLGR